MFEPAPTYGLMGIELTNHCPMKCAMCPTSHGAMTRARGFMDMALFRSLMDQYARDKAPGDAGTVWLHLFGESLLHPRFDEAVAYAAAAGARPGLSVNPVALTAEKAERLFRAGPHEIYLSIDGHDDESLALNRGVPGIYAETERNALAAIDACRRWSPGTRLHISIIDIPGRRDEVDKAERHWRERGAPSVLRKPFCVWNGDVPGINALTDADRLAEERVACVQPWHFLSVTWKGGVLPCCYDYNGVAAVGDARHESLSSIWNGERLRRFREDFLSDRPPRLCVRCPYRRVGG